MVYSAYFVKPGFKFEKIGDYSTFEEAAREITARRPDAQLGNINHTYGGQIFFAGPGARVVAVVKVYRRRGRGPEHQAPEDLPLARLECKRCDHYWHPRTGALPKVCPKCKSPYWDVDRQADIEAEREQRRKLKSMPMSERIRLLESEAPPRP